VNKIQS